MRDFIKWQFKSGPRPLKVEVVSFLGLGAVFLAMVFLFDLDKTVVGIALTVAVLGTAGRYIWWHFRPRVALKRGSVLWRVVVAGAVISTIAGCTGASQTDAGRPTPAVPRTQPAQTTAAAPAPTSLPSLAALTPVGVTGGLQPNGPVIIERSDAAQGPTSLKVFSPKGNALFVTFSCLGPGKFNFGGLFTSTTCDGGSSTITLRGQTGKTLALRLTVDTSTRWKLMVQDGNEPKASSSPT